MGASASAFRSLTREEATAQARGLGAHSVIASARFATGVSFYAARTRGEAQSWLNLNREYFYPGSDSIEEV